MYSCMSGNDLLSTADSVQKMAETMLGGKFETVVAMDDFAHKNHFKAGAFASIRLTTMQLIFRTGNRARWRRMGNMHWRGNLRPSPLPRTLSLLSPLGATQLASFSYYY